MKTKSVYRLWYSWNKSKRFETLKDAKAVADEVFQKTKIVLSITKDK
jgi:hypothetical protein